MSYDDASSRATSATMSATAPRKPASSAPPGTSPASKPDKRSEITEVNYLVRQQADAKDAMKSAAADVGRSLGHALDPRPLVKKHPWMTIGAAAVVGTAIVAATFPTKA